MAFFVWLFSWVFFPCISTLVAHVYLFIHQDPKVLVGKAVF